MPTFEKKEWTNRIAEHPGRRELMDINTQTSAIYDVVKAEGRIMRTGHSFDAQNINGLEERISHFSTAVSQTLYETEEALDVINRLQGGSLPVELTGTALPEHVLEGETFYKDDPDTKQTGSMRNQGNLQVELRDGNTYTIPEGYHNGSGQITVPKKELTGNAVPEYVLEGQSFYSNDPDTKKLGAMANNGSIQIELSFGGTYAIPKGYHDGNGVIHSKSISSFLPCAQLLGRNRRTQTFLEGGKVENVL